MLKKESIMWILIKLNLISLLYLLMSGCSSFSKQTAINDEIAQANVRLAIALLKQGYYKDAHSKLNIAKELSSRNLNVWLGLGAFYETVGELNQAQEAYRQALDIDPRNGTSHNNYGAFLYRHGFYPESLSHFLIAIKDPNYLDMGMSYHNAALCAQKMSNKTLSKFYFQKASGYEKSF